MTIINKIKKVLLYLIYFFNKIFGKNWDTFYAWLLNRIERKNNIYNILKQDRKYGFYSIKKGFDFLDVLKKQGLKKNMSFLDFGCGYGRIGIPVIKYLNKKLYTGIDLSEERIRLAKEYVKKEKLEHKAPILLCSLDKSLKEVLGSNKYNVILLFTVIVHNPLEEVQKILANLKHFIRENGVIYFDYTSLEKKKNTFMGLDFSLTVKDYEHSDEEIGKILSSLGFKYSFIKYENKKGSNWQLNNKVFKNKKFVKAVLK